MTKPKPKHTLKQNGLQIYEDDGHESLVAELFDGHPLAEKLGRQLVTSFNAHEELVTILRALQDDLSTGYINEDDNLSKWSTLLLLTLDKI